MTREQLTLERVSGEASQGQAGVGAAPGGVGAAPGGVARIQAAKTGARGAERADSKPGPAAQGAGPSLWDNGGHRRLVNR